MNIRKLLYRITFIFFLIGLSNIHAAIGQQKTELENELYKIITLKGDNIRIIKKGSNAGHIFSSDFTIMYADKDPELRTIYNKNVGTRVPSWNALKVNKRTAGFFNAAEISKIEAAKGIIKGNKIIWKYGKEKGYLFQAELLLPPGKEDPVISYQLKVIKPGWYSLGYTGAPETLFKNVDEMWQPFVWQEKRFPYMPFLSAENMCPLPAVLVNKNNYTIGVVADPTEIPFRFSTLKNSRFGVILRDAKGNARPMIFSPLFGGYNSYLKENDTTNFSFRIIIRNTNLFNAYKYIAEDIFKFHDYRKNVTCSLNETLENIIAYAMNDYYSGWVPELKGADYTTDVAHTVKNVSALHPLSISIVTDNKQIYERRALPMIEYLLSREKYLYAENTSTKRQSPSHYLKGPAANVSELAALYEISKERSPVFSHYAKELYGKSRVLNLEKVVKGSTWQNSLALFRMTGDKRYLDSAKKGADEYIKERIDKIQEDFSDVHIASGERFPTSWTPKWIDLLELFEATGEEKYLMAAKKGAELFINFIWMAPSIPDGNITINKGDTVGEYAYQNRFNPNPQPMKVPKQKVPAWHLSQTGLMPESTTTYSSNRAIFLTHYAAYLLRLAYYTHSSFFRNIARSAVVGRYANYPGYSITGEYTNVYSRADYPLRPLNELTYNNIYYNHVWPQIALLMDYLVSDAFTRSEGKINFPSRYAQGYAYLQSKVYGDRKGSFYGDKNVQLWLPDNLLKTDNIQANYIAGYGNDKLYVAFMNQSSDSINIKIKLNANVVPFDEQKEYKVFVWKNNCSVGMTTMQHGVIKTAIEGKGITAVSIEGISVVPQFQDQILSKESKPLTHRYSSNDTPLGKVHGMIIDMGKSLINAYVYLEATETDFKEIKIHYLENGKWEEMIDKSYPFEFSIPLSEQTKIFTYWVEGVNFSGKEIKTEHIDIPLE